MAIITLREKTLFRETRTINAFVRIINIFKNKNNKNKNTKNIKKKHQQKKEGKKE
jgi:hypothetical protein